MSAEISPIKPYFAIFLDIDGVVGNEPRRMSEVDEMDDIIEKKLGQNAFHSYGCKRCMYCSTAQSHLFDKIAVASLTSLINKISEVANVHIVISSYWREGRSIDQLKQIFQNHEFSKFIIDKTVDDGSSFLEWKKYCAFSHIDPSPENFQKILQNPHVPENEKTVDYFLDRNEECRASQIYRWLEEHPEYTKYLIFDDMDSHLSINFNEKFILTNTSNIKILKPEHTERAYKIALSQLQ